MWFDDQCILNETILSQPFGLYVHESAASIKKWQPLASSPMGLGVET